MSAEQIYWVNDRIEEVKDNAHNILTGIGYTIVAVLSLWAIAWAPLFIG